MNVRDDAMYAMAETVIRLTRERDEARRECCRWMAEAEGGTPEEHAQEQGWDCFTVRSAP